MNKKTIFRILLPLTVLLIVAIGIAVNAKNNDEDVYEIKAINIAYEDRTQILIAVNAPVEEKDRIEVKYTYNGKERIATYWKNMDLYGDGTLYPVYYTVGIPPKDIGEVIVAEAHKRGATDYTPAPHSISVAEYVFTRLYKDGYISKSEGEELHRKEFYLAFLEYGAKAQQTFWNDKPENADRQRTLVTDLIPVYLQDATANGKSFFVMEEAGEITLTPTGADENSVWTVTTWENGNKKMTALYGNTVTVTAPTTITPGIDESINDATDIETVRTMNVALAAAGATEPVMLSELYDVLSAAGFSASHYTPLVDDRYFFWDSKANVVLYTDKDLEVLFPDSQKNNANKESWISLSGKIPTASVDVDAMIDGAVDGVVSITDTDAIVAGQKLVALFEAIEDGDATSVTEVKLPANVNLMGADIMIDEIKGVDFKIVGVAGGSILSGIVVTEARLENNKNSSGTVEREYNAGIVGSISGDCTVTFENITIKNALFGNDNTSLVGALVGTIASSATKAPEVYFKNVKLENTTVRGLQKVGAFIGDIQDYKEVGTVVDFDASCGVTTGVTVEVTSGLAGGIVGYLNKGKVSVAAPANFDAVEVKLVPVSAGHYFVHSTTNANDPYYGMIFGLDLNGDLTPADKRNAPNAFYRYFPTVSKYGFVNGGKGDATSQLSDGRQYYEGETTVILGYGAVPLKVDSANTGATVWQYPAPVVPDTDESIKTAADKETVRTMNVALATAGATGVVTLSELYDVLSAAGFDASSYTPLVDDRYFFWDSEENVVLYTDKDLEVLFPDSQKNNANKESWISLSGKIPTADVNLDTVLVDGIATISTADPILAGQQLIAIVNAINNGEITVQEIIFPSSVNLMGADIMIDSVRSRLTFKGAEGGSTLSNIVINNARSSHESVQGVERDYYAGMIAVVSRSNVVLTFENITISDSLFGTNNTSLSSVFVGSAQSGAQVYFRNCDVVNTTIRGLQKIGTYVGIIQGNNTHVSIDANCDATNVTVQATIGIAGGIFGFLNKGTVEVAAVANFDDVKVEVVEVPTGHYITVDGVKYGLDLNSDLTPADKRDSGYYRYFECTAQYGFLYSNPRVSEVIITNVSGYNGETTVVEAYGAVPAALASGATSATWSNG